MTIEERVAEWAKENPQAIALTDEKLFKDLWKHLSREQTPKEGLCPFCKKNPCEHWNGLGWTNPKIKRQK